MVADAVVAAELALEGEQVHPPEGEANLGRSRLIGDAILLGEQPRE